MARPIVSLCMGLFFENFLHPPPFDVTNVRGVGGGLLVSGQVDPLPRINRALARIELTQHTGGFGAARRRR